MPNYPIIDAHCHIYPDKIAVRATAGTERFYDIHAFADGTVSMLLENGEKAFAFGIQLAPNTPVFCTVIRHRTEWSDTKVSVDSYPFEAAAA